ncbi:MAG TPA: hypothetical protein VKT78_13975 [Fimbriimonadaceae bacterium]|nr:hypothetical protein [Fimbriimonadaceae bacterium]
MKDPVICFGQQPCGFFPKRFLVSKIETARRLQGEIGGTVVYFMHDSDHDFRETRTVLRDRKTDEPREFNFSFENQTQRKFSPLYLKRVVPEWHRKTACQLLPYLDPSALSLFSGVGARNVADFCLEVYSRMGLLEGIQVVRSSDPKFRLAACPVSDFFVDVPYEGEIVRARWKGGKLSLFKGGDVSIELPATEFGREQISPARDTRFCWMQSVIGCTHYVCGLGEQGYMRMDEAPEVEFVVRDAIDRSDEAYVG